VHGIELSPHMAERMLAKPGAGAVPVTIGDMTTTRVPGTFRLVYLVANTIMNVTTQDDQLAVFSNAAAHLEPGGCFVVEVEVPQLRRVPPGQAGQGVHAGLGPPRDRDPGTAASTDPYGRRTTHPERTAAHGYSLSPRSTSATSDDNAKAPITGGGSANVVGATLRAEHPDQRGRLARRSQFRGRPEGRLDVKDRFVARVAGLDRRAGGALAGLPGASRFGRDRSRLA
jgi:hypothetical protein